MLCGPDGRRYGSTSSASAPSRRSRSSAKFERWAMSRMAVMYSAVRRLVTCHTSKHVEGTTVRGNVMNDEPTPDPGRHPRRNSAREWTDPVQYFRLLNRAGGTMTKRAMATLTIIFALAPVTVSAELQPPTRVGPRLVQSACKQAGFINAVSCYVLQFLFGPAEEQSQGEANTTRPAKRSKNGSRVRGEARNGPLEKSTSTTVAASTEVQLRAGERRGLALRCRLPRLPQLDPDFN